MIAILRPAVLLAALGAVLTLALPARAQRLVLPEPTMPEPRIVRERGPSPFYHRATEERVHWASHTALGIQPRLSAGGDAAFTLDALLSQRVTFDRTSRVSLLLQQGYSYVGFSEHFAVAGAGLLWRQSLQRGDFGGLWAAAVARGLAGSVDGDGALGARFGAVVGYAMLGLELSHQSLLTGPRKTQELHITFVIFSGALGT